MPEALEPFQDGVQQHAAESRFNGFIALFVAVTLADITALTKKRWLFGVAGVFAASASSSAWRASSIGTCTRT